jgi:hypothetical protein
LIRDPDRNVSRVAFQELKGYLACGDQNVDNFVGCGGLPVLEQVLLNKDNVCVYLLNNVLMYVYMLNKDDVCVYLLNNVFVE